LFGSSNYSGMGIKDYFVDQGCQQLKFLIGHTKANGDVGQQIKVLLSYIQLLTGIGKSVFTYNYHVFSGWTEHNWLSLIWDFCNKVGVTIELEDHWIPTPSRKHNFLLMDEAIKLNLAASVMKDINVLSLSYITTADSRTLLPETITGQPLPDRRSSLEWPH
jgi:hypothetical protein